MFSNLLINRRESRVVVQGIDLLKTNGGNASTERTFLIGVRKAAFDEASQNDDKVSGCRQSVCCNALPEHIAVCRVPTVRE
jgi:hypothetical protein